MNQLGAYVLFGIVLAALVMIVVPRREGPVQPGREGWRTIRPGTTIWATLVGSAGLSLLMFYV